MNTLKMLEKGNKGFKGKRRVFFYIAPLVFFLWLSCNRNEDLQPIAPSIQPEVAAGLSFSCAKKETGTLKCWGSNTDGELGQEDTTNRGDNPSEMGANLQTVNLGLGGAIIEIATGYSHSCARLDNNQVKCWGRNDFGQLGYGNITYLGDNSGEMGDALVSVDLGTGHTAIQISVGFFHSCALLDNYKVKCWGRNSSGQLGQEGTINRGDNISEMGNDLSEINLGLGKTVTQISAGGNSTCALLDDSSLKCWGENTYGQLGLGDTSSRGDQAGEMGDNLSALNLGAGRSVLKVYMGYLHACAELDNNQIKCWGKNSAGQLGLGDTANHGDNPNEMNDFLPPIDLGLNQNATQLVIGPNHTCALLSNSKVKCWGENINGQLGLGDTSSRGDQAGEMGDNLSYVDLGLGRTAKYLAAGNVHTCVLLDGDQVKCWGFNTSGQLGQGNTTTIGDGVGEMGDNLQTIAL